MPTEPYKPTLGYGQTLYCPQCKHPFTQWANHLRLAKSGRPGAAKWEQEEVIVPVNWCPNCKRAMPLCVTSDPCPCKDKSFFHCLDREEP